MKITHLILPAMLVFTAPVFAVDMTTEDQNSLTAKRISAMCEKMKPTVYTRNDAGTITRKGCSFRDHTYTIIYEVNGEEKYVKDMKESGIINQNAKNGDKEEMKRYCKSYSWLYSTKNLTKKIAVEYQDTTGKVIASKFIDVNDCSKL